MKNNNVLLIKKGRGPHKGKWDLPGGSIEFGEEPYQTLIREFEEETGVTELHGVIKTSLSYTLIHPLKEDELEEMHHIGIIYDVALKNESYDLKTDGDGQDSLGAKWIDVKELKHIPLTPFVKSIFSAKFTEH
jgi:8-oxo-dGTP diphosphatase